MADWLRPVFGRTKSSLNVSSTPTTYGSQNAAEDNKTRPTSRVANFMGISANTSAAPKVEPPSTAPTPMPVKPRPKLDCDRLVEYLKVVMMNHDTFAPLPREYNTYILHLLEAYQELREKLSIKQDLIDELRTTNAAELEEFENLAMKWELKENEYKLEVKRLEIMLSKTDGGVENVAIARRNSNVHGTERVAQTIGSGIKTIRGRHVVRDEQHYQEAKRQRDEEIRAAIKRSEGKCYYGYVLLLLLYTRQAAASPLPETLNNSLVFPLSGLWL